MAVKTTALSMQIAPVTRETPLTNNDLRRDILKISKVIVPLCCIIFSLSVRAAEKKECSLVLAKLQSATLLDSDLTREYAENLIGISVGSKVALPESAKVKVELDQENQIVTTISLNSFDDIHEVVGPLIGQAPEPTVGEKMRETLIDQLDSNENGIVRFIPETLRTSVAAKLKSKQRQAPPLEDFTESIWKTHVRTLENGKRFDRATYQPSTLQFGATRVIKAVADDGSKPDQVLLAEGLAFTMVVTGRTKEDQHITETLVLRYVRKASPQEKEVFSLPPPSEDKE